jgi:hypothetical protein
MKKHLTLLLILILNSNNIIKPSDSTPETRKIVLPDTTLLYLSNECPICLDTLDDKKKSILKISGSIVLKCGHHMHKSCFNKWASQIKKNKTCPTCRSKVTKKSMKWNKGERQVINLHLKILTEEHKAKKKIK